jgi:hypothetical protein
MEKTAFWSAFWAGAAAPMCLYAPQANYLAYIPGPADAFSTTLGFLNGSYTAVCNSPEMRKALEEDYVRTAGNRAIEGDAGADDRG